MSISPDLPPLKSPTAFSPALGVRLWAAWLAAAWQELWRRLWGPAALAGLCVAVALTDVLPALPGFLHAAFLAIALSAFAWLAARALRGFAWPSRAQARAWLESSSADLHRPLTTVEDHAADAQSDLAQALWQAHQARAKERLSQLRVLGPQPGVAARDRYALRAAAVLALAVGLAGAGGDAGPRMKRALNPAFDGGSATLNVKLWLTPPAYTNRSPVFLEIPSDEADPDGALDVPQGSKALVVITGTSRETALKVGNNVLPLERLADQSQRLETPLAPVRELALTQRGRVIAEWTINPIPDLPPQIAFTRPPGEAARWRWRIGYKASDDYGIAKAVAEVSAGPDIPESIADQAFSFELNGPGFYPKDIATASVHDLTAHPWAGLPVNVQLVVTDQAEQTAVSETVTAILPERVFNNPIARELAMYRKGLILDYKQAARPAYQALVRMIRQPDSFGGDVGVFLALSTAKARIAFNQSGTAIAPLADLLWQAAIRIEDGNLVAAEQKLDAAEQALREAMERDADAGEISRLIDQLQRALAEYARELAQRMPDGEQLAMIPPQNQDMFSPQDIANTMEQLRQFSQMGADDAARQMLSQLQEMLQTLRSAATADSDNPQVREAQDIMRGLQELTAEQSRLLEESFQKARQAALSGQQQSGPQQPGQQQAGQQQQPGQQGQPGQQQQQQGQNGQAPGGEQQEQLRKQLGELMGRMAELAGEVPGGLSEAEAAMREARDALNEGAWKPAADAQGEAVASMQQSMQQASQQLMQALAQQGLAGLIPMPSPGQSGFDPRGQRNGPNNGEDVDIPNAPDAEGTANRVRQILDEIRRRAADRTRPPAEQDYLRRLMKQF